MIIQSRRNLDKKMRKMSSRIKQKPRDHSRSKVCKTIESPCNRSASEGLDSKSGKFEKKKILQLQNRAHKEKNKENKEKIMERATKARSDIKLQSALDQVYIKKREEIIFQQKREKVNTIKNSLLSAKHKRATTNFNLKELNSTDYNTRILKINEMNKAAENQLKKLEETEEIIMKKLKTTIQLKHTAVRTMPERSFSVIITPKLDL